MEYLPRTYSVLSVAAAEKFHTSLRELLPGGRYVPVQFAYDAADARRRLLESRYDIIIISAPLRDEFGTHLAQHFAEQSGAGILLLVKRSLSMEDKMAEIRLINRAKWVLIEKQGMSEQDAHRYIEKQAMDRCVPKRVVAEEILR